MAGQEESGKAITNLTDHDNETRSRTYFHITKPDGSLCLCDSYYLYPDGSIFVLYDRYVGIIGRVDGPTPKCSFHPLKIEKFEATERHIREISGPAFFRNLRAK